MIIIIINKKEKDDKKKKGNKDVIFILNFVFLLQISDTSFLSTLNVLNNHRISCFTDPHDLTGENPRIYRTFRFPPGILDRRRPFSCLAKGPQSPHAETLGDGGSIAGDTFPVRNPRPPPLDRLLWIDPAFLDETIGSAAAGGCSLDCSPACLS